MSFWHGQIEPYPDELLSSWVVRLSRRIGRTAYMVLQFALGSYWWFCRDLDLLMGPGSLAKLAVFSGMPIKRLGQHRLAERFGRPRKGITPGILAAGIYHRKRRRRGLQYCPQCLLEQPQPHFKMEWRFALQFGCPKHHVQLRDACPVCDATVVPHRRYDGKLTQCHECGGSLLHPSVLLKNDARKACQWAHQAYVTGEVRIGPDRLPLFDLIRGMQLLFAFIAGPRIPSKLLDELVAPQIERPTRSKHDSLECSRTGVRAWAIPVCVGLFEDWPHSFLNACGEYGISRTRVVDARRSEVPQWVLTALDQLPHVPRIRRRPVKSRRQRSRGPKLPGYRPSLARIDAGAYLTRLIEPNGTGSP